MNVLPTTKDTLIFQHGELLVARPRVVPSDWTVEPPSPARSPLADNFKPSVQMAMKRPNGGTQVPPALKRLPLSDRVTVSFEREYKSVRPSSPTAEKDLSIWQEQICKPIILGAIQRRPMGDIVLGQSRKQLKSRLQLEFSRTMTQRGDQKLKFLELSMVDTLQDFLPARALQSRPLGMGHHSLASSSSESFGGQSSISSFGSQVSDSPLNDVEQSSECLCESLTIARRKLHTAERSFLAGLRRLVLRREILQGPAKEFDAALKSAFDLLQAARPDMRTIGFTDVGHQLNEYDTDYRDEVLTALKEDPRSAKRFFKSLAGHRRQKALRARHERYMRLTKATNKLKEDVGRSVRYAKVARDTWLAAAYAVVDEVVCDLAGEAGLIIEDTYGGDQGCLLLERTFREAYVQFLQVSDLDIRVLLDSEELTAE